MPMVILVTLMVMVQLVVMVKDWRIDDGKNGESGVSLNWGEWILVPGGEGGAKVGWWVNAKWAGMEMAGDLTCLSQSIENEDPLKISEGVYDFGHRFVSLCMKTRNAKSDHF